MNAKLRKQLRRRKRQTLHRIDKRKGDWQSPMIDPAAIKFELSEKQKAIGCGGLGMIAQLAKRLGLREEINRHIPLFKLWLPYDEADHVMNIAFNLLAGGNRLEHLELRRNDEAYLDALGAVRVPDPTTAGDFCRRFDEIDVFGLMTGFNKIRSRVWKQQPDSFFDRAIIEADGSMVPTSGQCKKGIGINYKGEWGYHPLIVTLANTGEPLFIANRKGNRPSHERAPFYFDQAIQHCRQSGFRQILLRGDTDFALTTEFDRWTDDKVKFVFGYDAMPNLVEIAEALNKSAWQRLERDPRTEPKTESRSCPFNYKQQVVEQNGYKNKRLKQEWVAEFDYQPTACSKNYRVIVVRKHVEVTAGQLKLFDDTPYFFYITNMSRNEIPTDQVVLSANARCDQENLISQFKSAGILAAPLDNLLSNWAYMVIASLAWSLKCWSALLIDERCSGRQQVFRQNLKRRLMRQDFQTYRQSLIMIPAQIVKQARRLIYRFLTWTQGLDDLFEVQSHISKPLRC